MDAHASDAICYYALQVNNYGDEMLFANMNYR